jgi:hypothetical protein
MPKGLPNNIVGETGQSVYLNRLRDNVRALQPSSAPGTMVSHTVHGVMVESAQVQTQYTPEVKAGWHFESKIELDPTVSYPAQSVVHIQSTSTLVTTGYPKPSAPAGAVVKAKPGIWVSIRSIPAKALVGAVNVYDVPQWPLPVATNLDDETNFWLYLGDIWCA